MNLNEAFMDITHQTVILDPVDPIDASSNQNANISRYDMDPLAGIEPIIETGDDVFGNIPDLGPASRRRKGGFRKSRPRTRKFQKNRRSKKLKAVRTLKARV